MPELPSGWSLARLTDLATINPEQLPGNTPGETAIEYLDIASIERTGCVGQTRPMTFAEAPSRARRRAKAGDVIVSTVRPYLRAFARLSAAPNNLVASTGFAVVRPHADADSEFLYQQILSQAFLDHLGPRMTGSNYPAVRAEDVGEFQFPLPPPQERRRVAAILSSVDDTIEKTEAVIGQLEVVKTGLLEALLADISEGRIPESAEEPGEWRTMTIGQLGDFSGGNGFKPSDWSNNGLPIIRIQNLNESQSFNYFAGNPHSDWIVEPGELLFAWAGSRGSSFGPCIWPGPRGVLNQHIHRIKPHAFVDKRFLYFVLKRITAVIEQRAHGFKDTLVHLRKAELTGWRVTLPSLAQQRRLSDVLEALDERLRVERANAAAARLIKSALLGALLSGRVRVNAPAQEAA